MDKCLLMRLEGVWLWFLGFLGAVEVGVGSSAVKSSCGLGFGVWGLGFGVLGFRVWGFRVLGLGFGLGFWV